MAAAVLSFQSISHFPSCLPFNWQLKLRKHISSLIEIADNSTPLCSLQLSVTSIASDGNSRVSRPLKTSASGRNNGHGDESKKLSEGNKAPKSADREEIIALFRRIQSSISKGEIGRDRTKSLSSSKDKSTAESVLDVLRESKNVRVTRSRKEGKASRWKRGVPNPKKMQGIEETPDFKISRLPSNFVKRSPIPHLTAPREMDLQQESESRPPCNFVKRSPIPYPTAPRGIDLLLPSNEGLKLANIEKLKLTELKELAKAKGIKGYSRLNKGELVQLLTP